MVRLFIVLMALVGLCSCAHGDLSANNPFLIDGLDTSDPSTYPPPCDGDFFLMPLDPNLPRDSAIILLVPLAYEMNPDKLLEGLSSETSNLFLQQLSERKTTLDDFYKQYGGWCDCAMSFHDSSKILKEIDPWTTAESKGMVQMAICNEEEKADIFNLVVEREGGRCYIKSDDPYGLLVSLSARVRECFKCYNPCTNEEYEPKTEPVPPPGMILIPGGSFMMGCTEGDKECDKSEKPPHLVTVKSFYIDMTEVTVAAYQACVNAGQCKDARTEHDNEYCSGGYWGYKERDDHPINCVNWEQAKTYCQWVGKRLPSEAEWEYAARGGHDDWRYPWGNEQADCSRAVMNDTEHYTKYDARRGCGRDSTWPVGSKGAFGYGLNDMAGNVWEWVEDCWHDDYFGAPTDGTAWVCESCYERVVRGSSWQFSDSWGLRVSDRQSMFFDDKDYSSGFRCAKSVE